MPKPKKTKANRQRVFFREWRKYRGLTLEKLAARIGVTNGAISQLERGDVAYRQDMLEALAEALNCDPADLIMRNPLEPAGIWSIWERALPAEREQIVSVAEALTKKRA